MENLDEVGRHKVKSIIAQLLADSGFRLLSMFFYLISCLVFFITGYNKYRQFSNQEIC